VQSRAVLPKMSTIRETKCPLFMLQQTGTFAACELGKLTDAGERHASMNADTIDCYHLSAVWFTWHLSCLWTVQRRVDRGYSGRFQASVRKRGRPRYRRDAGWPAVARFGSVLWSGLVVRYRGRARTVVLLPDLQTAIFGWHRPCRTAGRTVNAIPSRQVQAKKELGRYLTRKERACSFKVRHDKQSALTEAQRLQAKGETRIRAYQCPVNPNHWHVGRTKE
jgi:hypothetical protein